MAFKRFVFASFSIFACQLYAQTEYTETVPPSVLLRYDISQYDKILLAIGHKPIGKKDTFAGFYYEKDTVKRNFTVSSLGLVAFNFSQLETPKTGAELRIGVSETSNNGDLRKGFDIGLELHKYITPSLAIGLGGVARPDFLSYQSDKDNFAEYRTNIGVYYTLTDYFKLSGIYRYDAIIQANMEHETIYDGLQLSMSMLF